MARLSYDILTPGSYFCDVIFTELPQFPALGSEVYAQGLQIIPGGVLNTVTALHRLGVKVGWAGGIGDDLFSRFTLDFAAAEGIDTALLLHQNGPLQRVTVAMSYPHDRAFLTYVDPSPSAFDLLQHALERADFPHLHFSGLVVDERLLPIFDALRAQGVIITMDCQDRPYTLADPLLQATLQRLNAFMPNAGEALRLTGADTLAGAADRLRAYVPLLLVKDGGQGAHLWHEDDYLYAPALDVTPLDTTGAGDVFNAGFLAAWRDGRNWGECLRWGNISGGLSTQGRGGIQSAPHRAELLTRL